MPLGLADGLDLGVERKGEKSKMVPRLLSHSPRRSLGGVLGGAGGASDIKGSFTDM